MVAAKTVTLSLGTVGMLLGAVIWYRLWADSSDEIRKRGAFAWIVLIPGAAAVAYTLMASNVGYISVGGVDVPTLRYIDWIITTPVLIGYVAYPVIWASGPLGLGYVETFGVTLLITFTDVMAKTPYVYFVSVHRSAFDESSSTAAGKPTNTSVRTPAATDDDGRTAD